ncbi:MAG: response regulator [Eubacteriales bacterium]|nr:response regulator [Eubacteriales bacterium]
MYSLMIVEDELLARLALKNSISWEKFNIDEIYEAQDGMEALDKYRKYAPDILIVDINIPFMNGIELIQEIRKNDTRTKIIILSCLEDFQYAKAAIQANVSQYILKASMSIKEIEEAVEKVLAEIKSEKAGPVYRKKYNTDEEYRNRGILLRKLLTQSAAEAKKEQEVFRMPAFLAVFQVHFEIRREGDLSQEFLNKMNFVKSIISTTLREEFPCYVVTLPEEMYAVLIECGNRSGQDAYGEVRMILEGAGRLIGKYTSAEVEIGSSSLLEEQCRIAEGFRQAKRKLAYYSFGESGLTAAPEQEMMSRLERMWKECIRETTARLSEMGLSDMEEYVKSVPAFSEDYACLLQDYWSMLVSRTAVLYEKSRGCRLEQIVSEYTRKIRKTVTLKAGEELYHSFLYRIGQEHKAQVQYSPAVEKAIAFAEKNYGQPITLADAAEAVHVSSGYLSTIFRKEYGINYTEFLIQLRIEKAKILLAAGNERLADIAEKCGFNDHAYFTRTFKKLTGISPNDYRKSVKES